MRIVTLGIFWTLLIDLLAWVIIHFALAYLSLRVPHHLLNHRRWLFRTRPWELEGELYDKLFRVRSWKSKLPSGGKVVGSGFSMDRIESMEHEYLNRWVLETCRSELYHLVSIFPSLLFFLWNPPAAGFGMILYSLIFNLPLVIVQRHNRPRFLAAIAEAEQELPSAAPLGSG